MKDEAVPERLCPRCGTVKSVTEFYPSKTSKDGVLSWCKQCYSARGKVYYQLNRINIRARINAGRLLARYGITQQDYDLKLQSQHGGCAICGKEPPPGKKLHVDHDHTCCNESTTRKLKSQISCGRCVRGLLCFGCNTGIGIAEDPELLRKRADYVEYWRELHSSVNEGTSFDAK